ncbi:MAG TPA: hypothetical protein ENK77_03535 [Epsilonproteobacteria bacterium]|nr:hypothetical protein [Campylobacterota bacterium]
MIKALTLVAIVCFSTLAVNAAPPNPHTFVPNRGIKPSKIMAANMKSNISNGVRNVIYIWNRTYANPTGQISDLLVVFKYLSNAPALPRQMLLNKEFELYRVLDTKKMLKALDRFQEDVNLAYRALFEYSNLIIGSKQGSMDDAYETLLKEMNRMVKSYNSLAKVANTEYKQKVMPYYALDYKKERKKTWKMW